MTEGGGEREVPVRTQAETERSKYLYTQATKLLPEMRALFKGGKLTKREGWRNVAEHCFAQAVALDILCDALGIEGEEKRVIVSTAAVSDWDKRLEKRPQDFTEEERAEAERLIEIVDPDPELLEATEPEHFVRAYREGEDSIPFRERLTHYVDDITKEGEWTSVEDRIRTLERSGRRADMMELSKDVGGVNFFDYIIAHEERFETVLWARLNERLKAQGRPEIERPGDIPQWLYSELDRRAKESKDA